MHHFLRKAYRNQNQTQQKWNSIGDLINNHNGNREEQP